MHDLYAALIALGQFVFAAAAGHGLLMGRTPWWLTTTAVIGWVVLAGYEVGASAYRGWLLDESHSGALLACALALGLVLAEAIFGILILDLFLLPVLAALSWTIVRILSWSAGVLSAVFGALESDPNRPPRPSRVAAWRLALAAFDEAVLEPLRELDRMVYNPAAAKLRRLLGGAKATSAVLVVSATLMAGGCEIEHSPPRARVMFIVGIDRTRSIAPEEFAQFKPMIAKFVLAHARPGDEISLFPIGGDMKKDVTYEPVETARLTAWARGFAKRELDRLAQNDDAQSTDLGAALAFVERFVGDRRVEEADARIVALFLTDGKPTGKQTAPSDFPTGVRVWWIGVHPEHEAALRKLCTEAGLADSQIQVVQLGGWEGWVKPFGRELNRQTNEEVLKRVLSEVKLR